MLRVEVDVEPLTTGITRPLSRSGHKLPTDSPVSTICGDDRVENERMKRPIPGNIDKANELALVIGTRPAEAVFGKLSSPIVIVDIVIEALGMQPVERLVVDVAAPLVADLHAASVSEFPCGNRPGAFRFAYA